MTTSNLPSVPLHVSVVAGIRNAKISFGTPTSNGGSPIMGYLVHASTGQTVSEQKSPITVTGLTAGVSVSFTVAAINSVGTGPMSASTAPVVPVVAISH
jgi:hypothetical protein